MSSGLQAPCVFVLQTPQTDHSAQHIQGVPGMAQLPVPSRHCRCDQAAPVPLHPRDEAPQQTASDACAGAAQSTAKLGVRSHSFYK